MTHDNQVNYYNQESELYSKKRYEGVTQTYFQFLFKRRRELFLNIISKIKNDLNASNLLEIGCADGVLIKKLLQKLPNTFTSMVGVDVSPKMIDQARRTTDSKIVTYFLRGEDPEKVYDLVVELGVHAENFEKEIKFVYDKLKSNGYFIYCTAGKNSLHVKFKLKNVSYVNDYMSYEEYEKIINKYFQIVSKEVYGLFIPKLWAFPVLARFVQSIVDGVFKNISPNLFHEKIYLLRKR